jgi:murein DD-endopeptidase MepM/ murein hydrolase activator NlpD
MVTPKTTSAAPASASSAKSVAAGSEKPAEKNNPPAEADQMQFHKGLDIAVAYGSDVVATAAGTVIFPDRKEGTETV